MIFNHKSGTEARSARWLLAFALCGLMAGTARSALGAPPDRPVSIKEIVFTKDLTIGVVEGDENYMFGKSVGVGVDDRGSIYVLDWDRKQVRKFGPDGKYLLTFGRHGQGPGEFQNPSTVRFAPDGSLYVSENYRNRLLFFDPDGKFLSQTTLPENMRDIWITPSGTHLGIRHRAPMYVGQGNVEELYTIFDDKFRPIVELHKDVIDISPPASLSLAQRLAEGASYFLARPNPIATMGEDGRIYFGLTDAYAVDVYAPDGKKLRTLSRDLPAAEYSKKDVDFTMKNYEESMYAEYPEAVRKEILRLIRFPKLKPFFRGLVPMENGAMAVITDITSNEECCFDIFDRDGRFLGRVKAAIPFYGLLFKKGKAYCVRTDANGYHFVERFAYEIR